MHAGAESASGVLERLSGEWLGAERAVRSACGSFTSGARVLETWVDFYLAQADNLMELELSAAAADRSGSGGNESASKRSYYVKCEYVGGVSRLLRQCRGVVRVLSEGGPADADADASPCSLPSAAPAILIPPRLNSAVAYLIRSALVLHGRVVSVFEECLASMDAVRVLATQLLQESSHDAASCFTDESADRRHFEVRRQICGVRLTELASAQRVLSCLLQGFVELHEASLTQEERGLDFRPSDGALCELVGAGGAESVIVVAGDVDADDYIVELTSTREIRQTTRRHLRPMRDSSEELMVT